MVHFSGGNAKLKKDDTVTFNLPAGLTCPKAGVCKRYCYACKGNYQFPDVKTGAARNYEASLEPMFAMELHRACRKLIKRGIFRVRWHSSGDFYSQEYLDKCVAAMYCNPEIMFYAYTKSLHLDWSKALLLPNFVMIQSEGGLLDAEMKPDLPIAKIFANEEELALANARGEDWVNGSITDLVAMSGTLRIGLIKH
jgi:hypothetical protein